MLRRVAFAVASLGLLALLLSWRDPAPAPRSAQVTPAVSLAPRADESALAERVRALEQRVEQLSAALAAVESAPSAPSRRLDVRIEGAEETPLHGVSALSDALLNEDTDDDWEERLADHLLTQLDDPRWSSSGLLEIDCRTTLCRARIEHASEDEARTFEASLSLVGLDVGSLTTELETSGSRTVSTLVLLRSGSALPTQR
jgi:hypothetical protein